MIASMKDSGIAWVGDIPSHWSVSRMKYECTKITDYTASGSFASLDENVEYLDEPDYAMLVRIADLSQKREVGKVYINEHAYNFLSNSNLFGGEIILSNIGSVGEVFLFKPLYERSSLAPNAIMAISKTDNRYLYYYFRSPSTNEELKNIGGNAVQTKFNKTQLRQFSCIIPPLTEQKVIADYLDIKCSKIDLILSEMKEQLNILQEHKKSIIYEAVTKGLDKSVQYSIVENSWLKEIPLHWKAERLKYSFKIKKNIAGTLGYEILAVTQQGIKIKDITVNSGQLSSDYSKYQLVNIGDFVMNHMDLLTGFMDCSQYVGVTSPDYRVFVPTIEIDRVYYTYVFQVCYLAKVFYGLGQGVSTLGRWRLPASAFNNFIIPIPPLEEQHKIAEFLNERVSKIDSIIAEKMKAIESLELYEKSLIYEYVTGKKQIKEVAE